MRLTKLFTNVYCINLRYNALVRPSLEYAYNIWCPYQTTYNSKNERVQKKFTRYLFYKLHIPKFEYKNRLIQLNMLSLQFRRILYDMNTLHATIHTNINMLHNQLVFRNVPYSNRLNLLFQLKRCRTNYGLHMNIITRCQLQFLNYFNDIEILNLDHSAFMATILNRMHVLYFDHCKQRKIVLPKNHFGM